MKQFKQVFVALGLMALAVLVVTGCGGEAGEPTASNDTESSATSAQASSTLAYPIVDTGQTAFYDASTEIVAPEPGQPFYGQDAQYAGNQPSYTISSDGLTVHDNVTGLTWQKSPDSNGDGTIDPTDKFSFAQAQEYPATLNAEKFGGFDDWRLPTIKEVYSLIQFVGTDPDPMGTDTSGLVPFIDGSFDFAYGNTSAGERIIDMQYASSTLYVSTTMNGEETMFGVNTVSYTHLTLPTTPYV